MGQFSVSKGTLKLKEIDSIEILSERIEDNIYLHLQVNLRNGKTRQIGGIRLFNEQEPHPRRHLVSFKLPSESAWEKLKPNELTLGVPPLTAKWKLKEDRPQ